MTVEHTPLVAACFEEVWIALDLKTPAPSFTIQFLSAARDATLTKNGRLLDLRRTKLPAVCAMYVHDGNTCVDALLYEGCNGELTARTIVNVGMVGIERGVLLPMGTLLLSGAQAFLNFTLWKHDIECTILWMGDLISPVIIGASTLYAEPEHLIHTCAAALMSVMARPWRHAQATSLGAFVSLAVSDNSKTVCAVSSGTDTRVIVLPDGFIPQSLSIGLFRTSMHVGGTEGSRTVVYWIEDSQVRPVYESTGAVASVSGVSVASTVVVAIGLELSSGSLPRFCVDTQIRGGVLVGCDPVAKPDEDELHLCQHVFKTIADVDHKRQLCSSMLNRLERNAGTQAPFVIESTRLEVASGRITVVASIRHREKGSTRQAQFYHLHLVATFVKSRVANLRTISQRSVLWPIVDDDRLCEVTAQIDVCDTLEPIQVWAYCARTHMFSAPAELKLASSQRCDRYFPDDCRTWEVVEKNVTVEDTNAACRRVWELDGPPFTPSNARIDVLSVHGNTILEVRGGDVDHAQESMMSRLSVALGTNVVDRTTTFHIWKMLQREVRAYQRGIDVPVGERQRVDQLIAMGERC